MLNLVFSIGLITFVLSSAYFYFQGEENSFNSAFLVSFITLISYVLMWQGNFIVLTEAGQPIFWTRWLFYAASCTLLSFKIAKLKGIQNGQMIELLYLTAIVMFTGFLAAHDLTAVRWIHFVISCLAYALLVIRILPSRVAGSQWINSYLYFGWTVFAVVFAVAPTGLGLISTGLATIFYLVLDVYTKIVFYIQSARTSE
jgi:sensory rhodopsin